MARSHGRILARIWSDPDFRQLDGGAQRLYMLLLSQPNLTHAGTIDLTVRRWAAMSAGTDEEMVWAALGDLEKSRFVILDRANEELLVRTFIRNDGVYKQPNVVRAMKSEALAVRSSTIRLAIADELVKLSDEEMKDETRVLIGEVQGTLSRTLPEPLPKPSVRVLSPPNQVPETPPKPIAEGSSRTRAIGGSPSPTPTTPPGGANAPDARKLLAEHIEACKQRPPNNICDRLGKEISKLLTEGIQPEHIRGGLAQFRRKDVSPGLLPSLVNGVMNVSRDEPADRKRTDVDRKYG